MKKLYIFQYIFPFVQRIRILANIFLLFRMDKAVSNQFRMRERVRESTDNFISGRYMARYNVLKGGTMKSKEVECLQLMGNTIHGRRHCIVAIEW